jgi:ribonuclease Z
MLFAGVTASHITRICITHFHGDHCLGLPGVLQRMALDRVPHVVEAYYPEQSQVVFDRLRHAALFRDVLNLRECPVGQPGTVASTPAFRLEAQPLSHSVPTFGYRLEEPDGRGRDGKTGHAGEWPGPTSGGCSVTEAWSPTGARSCWRK